MAKVYRNFELGAGLTFQQGPFKYKKNERAPVQTVSWKGGGVPAGGQQHAGNGNWQQTMVSVVYQDIKFNFLESLTNANPKNCPWCCSR